MPRGDEPVCDYDLITPSGRRHRIRAVSRGEKTRRAVVTAMLIAVSLALLVVQAAPLAALAWRVFGR